MPVYEYACKACGNHLEVSQSFKDGPLTTCPLCGGLLRKVFGSIGIVLKGSGFYRTDSRLPAKKENSEKSGEKSGEKAGSPDKAAEKSSSGAGGGGGSGGDTSSRSTTSDAKPSGATKSA